MESTAQAQYLRIFTDTTTRHRWQSFYVNRTVQWLDQPWTYQPFSADGITAGDVTTEGSLSIGMPCTGITLPAMREALRDGALVEITCYEFDPQLSEGTPLPSQLLVSSYLGEVVNLSGTFTWLDVELGSPLAPIGVQMPPRTMTSQLIGVPCQL
jgi:hypothetical protein